MASAPTKGKIRDAGSTIQCNYIVHGEKLQITPAETGPLRKTPLIRSYGKQVIDLTELRGSWNVAYIYNKESLRKASQHHRKVLLLCRAKCRWIAICYYKVR